MGELRHSAKWRISRHHPFWHLYLCASPPPPCLLPDRKKSPVSHTINQQRNTVPHQWVLFIKRKYLCGARVVPFFLYLCRTDEMNRPRIYKSIGDDNAQSTDKTLSCKQKRKTSPPTLTLTLRAKRQGAAEWSVAVCRLARGHVLRICFFSCVCVCAVPYLVVLDFVVVCLFLCVVCVCAVVTLLSTVVRQVKMMTPKKKIKKFSIIDFAQKKRRESKNMIIKVKFSPYLHIKQKRRRQPTATKKIRKLETTRTCSRWRQVKEKSKRAEEYW